MKSVHKFKYIFAVLLVFISASSFGANSTGARTAFAQTQETVISSADQRLVEMLKQLIELLARQVRELQKQLAERQAGPSAGEKSSDSSKFVVPPKPGACPDCVWNMAKWVWEIPANQPQTAAPAADQLPPEQPLKVETAVALLCYYDRTYFWQGQEIREGIVLVDKGSGVMISSDGLILTNKHVIASNLHYETFNVGGKSVDVLTRDEFSHCNAGYPSSSNYHLPTREEIQSVNPAILLQLLPYRATVYYMPSGAGLSAKEKNLLDFAYLKIVGLSDDAPTFGVTSLPGSFEFAVPMTLDKVKIGDAVLTYGYPGDTTKGQNGSFETFYLQGAAGRITGFSNGDLMLKNIPLRISTDMEIRGGRSGSALFWRGYVIGLTTAHVVDNVTESFSVAWDAIKNDIEK
ncbi:MAG: trypsin-like peptidase domain-containing protein [Candidatus Liptonbacteria bacterium]|nr:trypsin-like peptidase domain-containing protein [Candidatus Liptonbacteria bacterium]